MSGIDFRRHATRAGLSTTALAMALLASSAAFAQDAAAPRGTPPDTKVSADGQPAKDGEILVTGSRVGHLKQRNLHSTTSTRVCTMSRGTSAGQ